MSDTKKQNDPYCLFNEFLTEEMEEHEIQAEVEPEVSNTAEESNEEEVTMKEAATYNFGDYMFDDPIEEEVVVDPYTVQAEVESEVSTTETEDEGNTDAEVTEGFTSNQELEPEVLEEVEVVSANEEHAVVEPEVKVSTLESKEEAVMNNSAVEDMAMKISLATDIVVATLENVRKVDATAFDRMFSEVQAKFAKLVTITEEPKVKVEAKEAVAVTEEPKEEAVAEGDQHFDPIDDPLAPFIKTIPILRPDVTEEAIEDKATKSKASAKKKASKAATPKEEVDLEKVDQELVESWDDLTNEDRYIGILKLMGITSAQASKALHLNPANRVMEAARGNRIFKGDQLTQVTDWFKSHEALSNTKTVSLITEDLFGTKA